MIDSIDSVPTRYSALDGVTNLQTISGISLFSPLVIYPENGDIQRFRFSGKITQYARIMPSVRRSSDVIHHGRITFQGFSYFRWIMVEAVDSHMINDPEQSITGFCKHLAKKNVKSKVIIAASNNQEGVYWILKDNKPY